MLELKDKIKSHLLAGYPGLYIQSGEEARVDAMLEDIAVQLGLSPKEWNLGYGWVDFFNKQPRGSQNASIELATSLPALLDDDLDDKLFIIKDVRSALEHQPLAVARLKQLLNRIQRHHRGRAAVVLVSESLHIPPQIEGQITLLPLPLPGSEEIRVQLDSVCRQLDLLIPEHIGQRLQAACCGLSQEEIRTALAMVRQQHEQINDAALSLIQHEKEQIIAKSGVLEMIKVGESAVDVGGLENLKGWLGRRAQIFRRLAQAREAGVQAPKGVLIAGMPGCGKSLTAKAAAGLFQLPLLRLDIGSLLGKYVGESEHNMRRALTMAESVSPCILWIDELEKAFVGMNSGGGSEVSSRLFGYFLTWMQEKTGAVFVIATANNITALPPELLRKGRFDEVFYVGFPNAAERAAILDIHLKGDGLQLSSDQRIKLVAQCRDYAGADIQNAINEARESAFLDHRELKLEDLEAAIAATVPLRETLREQVGKYEELFEKLKLKPASTCEGLSVAQMIKLADDPNAIRRETVASNPDCPDDLLEKLAGDAVLAIRTAVYRNPNCPERLLTLRINIEAGRPDYDLGLLHLACIHPLAPHDLLASQFSRLKFESEHKQALAQNSTHPLLLEQLVVEEDVLVRQALAHNKGLGIDIQRVLSKDAQAQIRLALAGNSGLLAEVQALLARDEDFDVREALARLPGLAEVVQVALLSDDDLDVRLALANRVGEGQLPETVQLQLVKDCVEVRLALAANPTTAGAAQLLLAQDAYLQVRIALAEHPALGAATLQYLAQDSDAVQRALAANRHWNSPHLQRALAHSAARDVRAALAGNPQVATDVLALLAEDADPAVREALASNDSLVAPIIETLLNDAQADVRAAVILWHTRLPEAQQLHIARDSEASVRRRMATFVSLTDAVQALLLDDVVDVQEELAGNRYINISTQHQLFAKGTVEIRRALAQNPEIDGSTQAMLADDMAVAVRSGLASNTALVAPVFDKLLKDVQEVQVQLASNTSLGEAQYGQLLKSRFDEVREALAGNAHISEALMAALSQPWTPPAQGRHHPISKYTAQPKPPAVNLVLAGNSKLCEALQGEYVSQCFACVPLMEALARNPALDETVQMRIAGHDEMYVREFLAANPGLALNVARKLVKDSTATVRAALVRNQALDRDIEQRLAADTTARVRRALAVNQRLSKRTQLLLAVDPEKDVRTALLQREPYDRAPALRHLVQARLATDKDLDIRKLLAAYPRLSPSLQRQLASDESITVRKALAQHNGSSSLSEEVQLRLLNDPETSVRLALATNRQLLPQVQLMLARDSNIKVRLALIDSSYQWHPHLSLDAQMHLANDPEPEVRVALADKLFGMYALPSAEPILLALAGDKEPSVKQAIVDCLTFGGIRYSEAVKTLLLNDVDEDTREMLEDLLESSVED